MADNGAEMPQWDQRCTLSCFDRLTWVGKGTSGKKKINDMADSYNKSKERGVYLLVTPPRYIPIDRWMPAQYSPCSFIFN